MSGSISRRMLGGGALLMCVFLGLAGLSLQQAYHNSSERALQDQLQAHLYLLLATAKEDAQGRPRLPDVLSAPEFNRPDSGFYASVAGLSDNYHWQSGSLIGRTLPVADKLRAGERRIQQHQGQTVLLQGIGWEDLSGTSLPYVFAVAMDTHLLAEQHRIFRTSLWGWLIGLGLVLLLVLLLLVRWGLKPLRDIATQVQRIEAGQSDQLDPQVPRELAPLTQNLNSLIRQTQIRQERLRNALADLAHSLKTPLAVLRGMAQEHGPGPLAETVDQQTERIDQVVQYQRQRLAVAGHNPLAPPQALRPILQRLGDSLRKTSHSKQRFRLEVPESLTWRADQGDLFELFGNLLENAFKYGRQQVRVRAQQHSVLIEDDGPGIPAPQINRLLRRGERGDQAVAGQGIGLAVAHEIVHLYGGQLQIQNSPLGGACIRVSLR